MMCDTVRLDGKQSSSRIEHNSFRCFDGLLFGSGSKTMTRALSKAASALAIIFFLSIPAFAQIQVPPPQGMVNDFAGKLSPQTRQSLENLLTNFRTRTGVEATIVTAPEESLGGYTIEEYALALGRTWKVGRASDKRGLVLLAVVKPSDDQGCHGQTRLEVSRHLEGDLPDGLAWEVIRRMRDDFKACRFDQAFTTGTQTLLATVAQRLGVSMEGIDSTQAYRPPQRRAPSRGRGISPSLIIFAVFVILIIIAAIGGRGGGGPGGRRHGRRGLGGAEWMLLPIIFGGGQGGWGGSRGSSGWGGGGGGWGGGGGGFGGFGGGGDFGGGGASDSW